MTASANNLLAKRKQGLTMRTLDGDVLVYDPGTTRASCLNEFAAEVLSRCDGKTLPSEIARDMPFEDVDERVVLVALANLQKAELLETGFAGDAIAGIGASRRDFFRQIGVGTAMAVPVVAGIVLPAAAQEESLAGPCESCAGRNCQPDLNCDNDVCCNDILGDLCSCEELKKL